MFNNVYITQYNHEKIIPEEIDLDIYKNKNDLVEYVRLKNIFNEKETDQFIRLWYILEHPEFLAQHYLTIENKYKPESYSSYHYDSKCPELSKHHLEYSIDSRDKKIRDEISSKCRYIFRNYTYSDLYNSGNKIRFDFDINQIIGTNKNNLDTHDGKIPDDIYQEINTLKEKYPNVIGRFFDILPNSGIYNYENQSLEFIESEIKEKLDESEKFRNSNEFIRKKIDYITFANISRLKKMPGSEEGEWVKKYKEPLLKLVQHYYWIKFNPELTVEKTVLDSLGFKACKRCMKNAK